MSPALAIAGFLTVSGIAHAQQLMRVRIDEPDPGALADRLHTAGFDVLGAGTSWVDVIADAAELEQLRQRGWDPQVIQIGRPLRDILAERAAAAPADAPPDGYPTLAEINDALGAAASAYPDIVRLVDITQMSGGPQTHEGRHIFGVMISDNAGADEDEPATLIVSNHHAREIITPVIALDIITRLTEGYGVDPVITGLVDDNEIWIVPTANPDGYEYVFTTENFWRKNRRDNGDGTFGVDQNRNYPIAWDGACSGSTRTGTQTYRGPSAGSEPETQVIMAFSADRNFIKVHDYHSFGRVVIHGYSPCETHPFAALFEAEGVALADASGYAGEARLACCAGENIGWQTARGALSFLTETHSEFQPPYADAVDEAALVWPGTVHLLQRDIPLSGHVRSARSGEPIEAEIDLLGVAFSQGERFTSGRRFGRYGVWAPPGDYEVRFSADGFDELIAPVTLSAGEGTVLEVELDGACYADCDGTGVLDLFDFLCFQNLFGAGDPAADCDGTGVLDLFDFLCFQNEFATGCP